MLTEHTCTNAQVLDQTSICEGIGGNFMGATATNAVDFYNIRSNLIQATTAGNTTGAVGVTLNPRRYQINLGAGLFTQDKLIPLKWMASQLAVELYLESPVSCIIADTYSTSLPDYELDQVNFVAEMLEFDSSYDAAFLNGLKGDGVPLKICSWHTFTFANAAAASLNLQIQERSRSVKAAFMVQTPAQTAASAVDTKAMLMTSGSTGTYLKNAQWR